MSTTPAARPTPAMVTQAAQWAAALDDERATQEERDACEAWCRLDPLHRLAFERMRRLDRRFEQLSELDRQVLRVAAGRPGRSASGPGVRAARRGALLGICLLFGLGWLATGLPQVRALFPDERTERGERRAIRLADGSGLTIDTDTALDIRLSAGMRRIELFGGRILAEVAHDPERPFAVATADGTVTALGTAFSVRRDGARTLVTVIASRVRACPAVTGSACLDLGPGEQAQLAGGSATRLAPVDPDGATAWTRGWFVIDDQPLTAVLEELNRYRAVPVRFEARTLQGLRVTGSLPLDDSGRALDALAGMLGLRLLRPDADGPVVLPPER
ncbi:FecR family protein [Rhodocista pekingensis]|uniref:FecR family protein n=1 Tax=Rhodocista pekingensis TaxID=201185 RepID=A0ABW2L1B5_9PROT